MVLEYILLLPNTTMYIKTCGIDLTDLKLTMLLVYINFCIRSQCTLQGKV